MAIVDMTVDSPTGGIASALRRLYLVRSAFAVLRAGLLFVAGARPGPLGTTPLVAYPLFDVAAEIADLRVSRTTDSAFGLRLNIAMSLFAALGLGLAGSSGVHAVLLVWGAWAVVAGLVQVAVAIARRALGGQRPMILSGVISVPVGTYFNVGAFAPDPSLSNVAGHAVLGGVSSLFRRNGLRHAPKEH
ncbi:hypothetical protein [Lentzea sp. E54]|uniref:hypothetical protein n=1 Tax=Lentzea xerophila TaxID=3435883 RepID=UPI003DA41639